MFWIANRINSWFHGNGMWKATTLLVFTLSFFVVPVVLSFFIHTQQFKALFGISGAISMFMNVFLIVYVRQICYDMKDKRVRRFFHERWLRLPNGDFAYLSMIDRSDGYSSVSYRSLWNMEEVLYIPEKEELKRYGKVEFHSYVLYHLQPVSKKDIKKYDLEIKLAKALLGESEPE